MTEVNGTPVWSAHPELGVTQAVMSLLAEFLKGGRPPGYFPEGGVMTIAKRPPWGTTRESVTAWLTRYGAAEFTETGVVRGSVKYPKLGEGDAETIVKAAGITNMEDEVIDTEEAITDHRINLDSGAGREDLQESRETRDGSIEEFIGELRKRLLPEAVAAEEAQMERLYPAGPLPGLGSTP